MKESIHSSAVFVMLSLQINNLKRHIKSAHEGFKPFKWIDYSGIHDEKRIGLLLIPSNKNKMESWAHSRDYGVLVANPFPKQPQERREPYVKTLIKKGEKLKMQYRVLIHENQKGQFDPKRIADHLLNQ